MPDGPSAQGAAQMKESEVGSSWQHLCHNEIAIWDLAWQEKMNLESFLNYVAFNKKAEIVMG